jgi:hypothetical protein
MLGKKRCDGFTPEVSCSTRSDTVDKSNGLPFVERGLGCGVSRKEEGNQEYAKKGARE